MQDALTPRDGDGAQNWFLESLHVEVQAEFIIHSFIDVGTSCCLVMTCAAISGIFPDTGIFPRLSQPILPFRESPKSPHRVGGLLQRHTSCCQLRHCVVHSEIFSSQRTSVWVLLLMLPMLRSSRFPSIAEFCFPGLTLRCMHCCLRDLPCSGDLFQVMLHCAIQNKDELRRQNTL